MKTLMKASTLAVLLALAGCASERVAVKLDLPAVATATAPAALDKWWESFGDPTLTALVDEALQHNSDVLIASERVAQSRGALDEARAALVPSVNAGLAPSRSAAAKIAQQPGQPVVSTRYKGGLQASWEIDLFGRLSSLREAARAQLAASDYARLGTRSSVAAQTARSYFSLLGLDANVALLEQTLTTRNGALKLQQDRNKAGANSDYELSLAQAEQAQIAAALPTGRAAREKAEAALAVLLGRSPRAIIESTVARGGDLTKLAQAAAIPTGLDAGLLQRRPDVRLAEARLRATEFNVDAARAAYFPTLSLTGFFGGESSDLGKMFDSENRSWSLAGALTQPLVGLAAVGARVDTARAARSEAVLNYEQSARNAYRDVKSALAAHQAANETLVATGTRVQAQARVKALAETRYKLGAAPYLETLDAERNRLAAERDQVDAQRERLTALVDVYLALGGGWSATEQVVGR